MDPLDWPAEWRWDTYVLLSGRDDIGVKWREEPIEGTVVPRLEFKGRTEVLGRRSFGVRAIGRVDRWVKWSCEGDAAPARARELFRSGPGVVRVGKKRLLRKLDLAADEVTEIRPAGAGSETDRALYVEIARVRIGDADAETWTLGFEAYPPDPAMISCFDRCVTRFLEDLGLALSLATSLSYPAWLLDLRAGG